MKIVNIEKTREINGGAVTVTAFLTGLGTIYGAYEACCGAWKLGWWLGDKIRGK